MTASQPEHPAPAARTLILLRHGKSDYPAGVADHDRPLAPRGESEAALAGRLIDDTFGPVDAVLCSTALRTRETLSYSGIQAPTTYAPEIYDASAGEILAQVSTVPSEVSVLLVVGHSPGMPGLALTLADDNSDGTVYSAVQSRFPTSAFAVLRVRGPWDTLSTAGAELSDFVIARHD